MKLIPQLGEIKKQSTDDLADDLSALSVAIERLNAMVSRGESNRHDLLNAVAAVKGYSEMLLDSNDALIGTIRSGIRRMIDELTATSGAAKTPESLPHGTRSLDTFEGCTILVVDDLPENLDLMSRLLGKMQCEVITADSGQEALDRLTDAKIDIVLLDLVMPGIDGREVLAQIKADEHLRALPVIMISGRQDMDQIIDCIQVGADDYLLKPVNSVLLSARIKSASNVSAGTSKKSCTASSLKNVNSSSDKHLAAIFQTRSLKRFWKNPKAFASEETCGM